MKDSHKDNIKLILNKVLIVLDEPITQTASGLYIPDTADKPRNTGVIIARGEHCVSSIKEGDRVLIAANSGEELSFHENKYLLIREDNVHGVIPD